MKAFDTYLLRIFAYVPVNNIDNSRQDQGGSICARSGIYRNDVISVFTSPTLALLVIAIMFLPSSYAWFNIESNWDPYSNTSGIKVAVVNEDEGASIRDIPIHVGDQAVANLKENKKLGWVFVNREEADRGVKHGDYYASLTIPKDFSKKLISIFEANPQQPEIEYAVNEKLNPIAPKIVASGANSVTSQISQTFIQTVGDAIFSGLNAAGIEIQKELPSILNLENRIYELEQALPHIKEAGNKAIELESRLPEITAKLEKLTKLQDRIPLIQQAGESIIKLENDLPIIDQVANQVIALQDKVAAMKQVVEIIESMKQLINNLQQEVTATLNQMNALRVPTSNNETVQSQLEQQLAMLDQFNNSLQISLTRLQEKIENLSKGIDIAGSFMENELPAIKQKIKQAAEFVRNDLPKVEADLKKAAEIISAVQSPFESVVHKTASLVRNDLPSFEAKITKAAEMLRKVDGEVNWNEVIEFLRHDPEKVGSFLSDPVQLTTKRVFPIPNYGSAMAPLYTMLALWVGGIVLISALPVNVDDPAHQYKSYQVYFGRLLTFLSVGIFQAAIVTLGDLYIIGIYAVNKVSFVWFGIIIGFVFVTITYTLRSVFGNIGNGIAMLFLVLQMSSSGATFPVSTTSTFFQTISPFMPFTYAVSMLREAVGGILPEIVIRDILALLLFAVISFCLGLLLKRALSKGFKLNSGDGNIE